MTKLAFAATLSLALSLAGSGMARAQAGASEASALSMLPLAVSVTAPAVLLSAGTAFTVVAVEAASEGTVWVLKRVSDGAQASLTLSSKVAGTVSVAAGTAIAVTAISTGWVLSTAGQAIAFVPNEIGKALLHNERVTR